MMDEEFINNLVKKSGTVKGYFLDHYILTPLKKKHDGCFLSFLIDFTHENNTDIGTKLLFDEIWNLYKS